jgi:hypothetical protein
MPRSIAAIGDGVMRLFGLVVVAGVSFSGAGICQTTDPADFRLSVAYCLGTRAGAIEQFEKDQRRDCVVGVPPTICDSDTKTIAALQSEAARLRLYLFSKFEEGTGGIADAIATKRGTEDASAVFDAFSSCSGVSNSNTCFALLQKTNPILSAASDRIRRCAQTIQMLPF